jgi:AcrR family transcriptional regulator
MKETTQHNLLEASIKLISEKGYLGATTREIAQEAGVTELTLFRHFGSKEKLFEEVLRSYTFLPTLKELLPELDHLSCEDALRLVGKKFLLTLKKRKSMIKIMHSELNLYPGKIRAVFNQSITDVKLVLAQYFETLRQKGMLRDVSPETAAQVFLSILFSYFRNEEIIGGHKITKSKMDKDVQEFIDIILHGTLNGNHEHLR